MIAFGLFGPGGGERADARPRKRVSVCITNGTPSTVRELAVVGRELTRLSALQLHVLDTCDSKASTKRLTSSGESTAGGLTIALGGCDEDDFRCRRHRFAVALQAAAGVPAELSFLTHAEARVRVAMALERRYGAHPTRGAAFVRGTGNVGASHDLCPSGAFYDRDWRGCFTCPPQTKRGFRSAYSDNACLGEAGIESNRRADPVRARCGSDEALDVASGRCVFQGGRCPDGYAVATPTWPLTGCIRRDLLISNR